MLEPPLHARWTSSWRTRAVNQARGGNTLTPAWWREDTPKGTGDTVGGALNTWSRVVKEGYEKCTKLWENKHKKCVERVIR